MLVPAITVGFGTAVAMWLLGYLTHIPAIQLSAPITGALLLAVLASGGLVAGRLSSPGRAPIVGALTGAVASLVNLLIVGAVVAPDDQAQAARGGWALIALGTVAFGAILGALAAPVGARWRRPNSAESELEGWLARFGLVTAASALPVLLSGGLVTSTNAGLAVPDWPTSFSANMFLFPLSKMTGGIYYEHAHRLFGSLVGLTTLVLLVLVLTCDSRRWVKGMAGIAFLGVCAQGVLGGVRVTAATGGDPVAPPGSDHAGSLLLAMIHGVTAQFLFALLCVLAAVLSPAWRRVETRPAATLDSRLRLLAWLFVAAAVVQLLLGSVTRHFQHTHAMFTHVGFALVVLNFAVLTGFRAIGHHRENRILRRLGHATLHTVILQLALGVVTLIGVLPYESGKADPAWVVLVATAHQGFGALLLALASLLVAWSARWNGTRPIPAAG